MTKRPANYLRFETRGAVDLLYIARDGQQAITCGRGQRDAIRKACAPFPSGTHNRRAKIIGALREAELAPNLGGRPRSHPEGHTRQISTTLPEPIVDALTARAEADGVSRSELIAEACRRFLGSSE